MRTGHGMQSNEILRYNPSRIYGSSAYPINVVMVNRDKSCIWKKL